jgi:hypothetical protein
LLLSKEKPIKVPSTLIFPFLLHYLKLKSLDERPSKYYVSHQTHNSPKLLSVKTAIKLGLNKLSCNLGIGLFYSPQGLITDFKSPKGKLSP